MTRLGFHHVGVVTKELQRSTQIYEQLGYVASQRYDDPLQKVAIVLLSRPGSPTIELILPTTADSPAAGWLKRIKAGPYHTCYEVADIAEATRFLQPLGFVPLGEPVPAVAFGMRPVLFLWSTEVGLLELLQA
jgi:methylmalonyl-CoA/ethylmalonyl-CoA epimerase